jgi:hypothetical protein
MQGGNLSIPGKPSSARYSVPYMPGVLIFNEFSTKNWNFPSFLYAEKQLTYSQIILAIIVILVIIYIVLRLMGYRIYFNPAMLGAMFRGNGKDKFDK